MPSRRRHSSARSGPAHATAGRPQNRCRALLIIDNAPLQAVAWAELIHARRRLEKATREVHRHEQTDTPAFRTWLSRTFPVLLSAVRELAQQVDAKMRLVQAVESESFFTGRSSSRIWREWQQNGGHPPPSPADDSFHEEDDFASADHDAPDLEDALEKEMKRMFAEEGIAEDDPFAHDFRNVARDLLGIGKVQQASPELANTRDIYRRLVRQLHPDSGGEWTATRARLWEQVLSAWEARDADWLARLEAEWEASADLLGPTSPVGRLRAALAEIDAARRDAEKRVREYRKDDAWRFSLRAETEQLRARLKQKLRHDEALLRDQLTDLEAVISRWERAGNRRRPRNKSLVVEQFNLF